jgi:hypothetical protein
MGKAPVAPLIHLLHSNRYNRLLPLYLLHRSIPLAANDNSLRKVQEGWEHVELDPKASEAEEKAAKLQGTWRKFKSHHQDKQNGPFIYKQKPFEAHEEEQLLNEIIFQTRNR